MCWHLVNRGMTADNTLAAPDIVQIQHENGANALRGLMIGKTTGGDYVEVQVSDTGVLNTA